MKFIVNFILWIWQLPQNLVGLFLAATSREKMDFFIKKEPTKVYFSRLVFGSGVSLGNYIILDYHNYYSRRYTSYVKTTVRHEYGHTVQSKILGPLYLIFVGIISALFNNIWDRLFHKKWDYEKREKWYYNRYPENWADKLGGVIR